MLGLLLLAETAPIIAWPVGVVMCPEGTTAETFMVLDRSQYDSDDDNEQEVMWSIRCLAAETGAPAADVDDIEVLLLFFVIYTPVGVAIAWLIGWAGARLWRRVTGT